MSLASIFEDEIHNRLRIVEAAGVVIAARFVNDHDLATEFQAALLGDQCDLQRTTHQALARPLELNFN